MPSKLSNRYAKGLLALGYVRQRGRPRHRAFINQSADVMRYVWLGNAGAVLFCPVNRVEWSVRASREFRAQLLAAADAQP